MSPAPLAVVIPCRNEAPRLPALLADLAAAPAGLIAETVVVDGGSRDGSAELARLAGARLLRSAANRGLQLQRGIAASTAPWLLLLHADARLGRAGLAAIQRAIQTEPEAAWYFDLAVDGRAPSLRLLELAVRWRSRLRQLPYGDQGLLLPRPLLERAGGMAALPLMEDLDLVLRLQPLTHLRSLGVALPVDGRRWRRLGVLGTAWRNARLRRAWRQGQRPSELAAQYYRTPAGTCSNGDDLPRTGHN